MAGPVSPNWNEGPAKQATLDFVAGAITPGDDFNEVAERIAAFDNDGTLRSEQPLPPQFDFVFRKWGEEVKATLFAAFSRSWAGTTPEAFDAAVDVWLQTVKQPKFDVPYLDLIYKPMLELIEYLTANEFRVFVCSGGGRDFMRAFAEEAWGINTENVIGVRHDGNVVYGKGELA